MVVRCILVLLSWWLSEVLMKMLLGYRVRCRVVFVKGWLWLLLKILVMGC